MEDQWRTNTGSCRNQLIVLARLRLHPIIEELRGRLGDLVLKRYGDRIILSRKADMTGVVWSPAQGAQRQRFAAGIRYARSAMADPEAKAFYEAHAARTGRQAFRVAQSDFMHAPRITALDVTGYTGSGGASITVAAEDDVEVVRVSIRVEGESGEAVETGEAEREAAGRWRYQASTPGGAFRIVATAFDRAGNPGVATAEVGSGGV